MDTEEYALYGYSLFETLLAKQGCFWRLEHHHARLVASARALDLEPPDQQAFFRNIAKVHNPHQTEVLRYTLFKGGGRWSQEPNSIRTEVLKLPFAGPPPVELRLSLAEPPLPVGDSMRCHKSGSRLQYQVQWSRARARGWDDCLFVDNQGNFLEASTYTLYCHLDGEWLTPPKALGVLPGIGRGWLLERGLVREAKVKLGDLPRVAAMAASNSVMGLIPVSRLADHLMQTERALDLIQRVGNRDYRPLPPEA